MPIEEIRNRLRQQYRGATKWVKRVNSMSDSQAIAIYYRMLRSGQIKS